MLDASFVMPKQENKYDLLPKGVYHCQLTDISQKLWEGQEEPSLNFEFSVIEDGEHYGRKIWQSAALKLTGGTKKSNLYKVLEGLTDKSYSKEECNTAHEWLKLEYLLTLMGTQKKLIVSHAEKKTGGMKVVIDAYMPLKDTEILPAFDQAKVKKAE